MNPITVFQLASWTIGLWDYWLVGIEAGAGPISHKTYFEHFGKSKLPILFETHTKRDRKHEWSCVEHN